MSSVQPEEWFVSGNETEMNAGLISSSRQAIISARY